MTSSSGQHSHLSHSPLNHQRFSVCSQIIPAKLKPTRTRSAGSIYTRAWSCLTYQWLTSSTAPQALPDDSFHSADELLGPALAGVDGGRRGLVQVCLGGRAHLAAVVVGVAPLAVAHGPVAVAAAAARREARDDSSPDVRAAVLENKKGFIRPQVSGQGWESALGSWLECWQFPKITLCKRNCVQPPDAKHHWPCRKISSVLNAEPGLICHSCSSSEPSNWHLSHQPPDLEQSLNFTVVLLTPAYSSEGLFKLQVATGRSLGVQKNGATVPQFMLCKDLPYHRKLYKPLR